MFQNKTDLISNLYCSDQDMRKALQRCSNSPYIWKNKCVRNKTEWFLQMSYLKCWDQELEPGYWACSPQMFKSGDHHIKWKTPGQMPIITDDKFLNFSNKHVEKGDKVVSSDDSKYFSTIQLNAKKIRRCIYKLIAQQQYSYSQV